MPGAQVFETEMMRLLRDEIHAQRKHTRDLVEITRDMRDHSAVLVDLMRDIRDAVRGLSDEVKQLREAQSIPTTIEG